MNCFPPASVANSSSGIGRGYWSTCSHRYFIIPTYSFTSVWLWNWYDWCCPFTSIWLWNWYDGYCPFTVIDWIDNSCFLKPLQLPFDLFFHCKGYRPRSTTNGLGSLCQDLSTSGKPFTRASTLSATPLFSVIPLLFIVRGVTSAFI